MVLLGAYIEKVNQSYFIRAEGKVKSLDDIENIVVKRNGTPIYVKMWLMFALVMRTVWRHHW
jgi:Cu/Ag efflux pump CusA